MTIPNPEKFFRRAVLVHGTTYDYTESVYVKSGAPITIRCKIHGYFSQKAGDHLNGSGCKNCAKINRKATNLEKYGVEYPTQNKKVQATTKQTNLKKYGVEHPLQNKQIYDHVKQTRLEKYGVEHVLQNKAGVEKLKQTCMIKYGVEHALQKCEKKEQQEQTMLLRYGVCHAAQSDIYREKKRKHSRYSVQQPSQHYMDDVLPKISNYNWLMDQYINHNKTAIQIATELGISDTTLGRYLKKSEIDIKQKYSYSVGSILWLETIVDVEQIHIQHAQNGGEFKIPNTNYKVDGYCVDTNTIYEFHGDFWHGNPEVYSSGCINNANKKTMGELYQKTIEREEEIKSLGYNLVVMWENEWNKL